MIKLMNDNGATITKVENGYTVELTYPKQNKDDWEGRYKTFVCSSLDEAMKKVEDYFTALSS